MKRLNEGQVYEFRVEKKLSSPGTLDHFVLSDRDGKKFLLPANTYIHYKIRKGTTIRCRVDKINCRGEIFLEPQNPYYSEGRSYLFIVKGHDIRTDCSGREINVFLVQDLFKHLIAVPCDTLPENGTSVRLTVERISKGRLYLFPYYERTGRGHLTAGRRYEFRVEKTGKGLNDEEYYIISDSFGDTHALSRSHYEYYGFVPGDTIRGKVVKHKKSGEKIIEPDNPYYKTGTFISLQVTGYTQNTINDTFTLDLKDKFGFTHCIQTKILPEKESVRCRVKMIRKGKPFLILM